MPEKNNRHTSSHDQYPNDQDHITEELIEENETRAGTQMTHRSVQALAEDIMVASMRGAYKRIRFIKRRS